MRLVGCIVFLCVAVVGGCRNHSNPIDPTTPRPVTRSFTPAIVPEGLYVSSILLERPVGDAFIDRDLWATTVPAGEPESRALLAENGLRAGILLRSLPQQFQDLLESESNTVAPQGLTFNTRTEAVIPTAGPVEPCKFTLLADLAGQPRLVELKQARCGILVKPRAAEAGRVRIWCEPQIQYGARRDWYRPTEDGTGFVKLEEIPLEKYPALGFEAILEADDCLVIGWQAEQSNTIGSVLFGVEADNRPRQRVLVIRARQIRRAATSDLPVIAGPYRPRR